MSMLRNSYKTLNLYVKHSYIRITYGQKSICKTVVGNYDIRIQNLYVIIFVCKSKKYYLWIYL